MVQVMPMHFQTPSSLASVKSRLVLPYWYWLTRVVLAKRPLNGYSSSSGSCAARELKGPVNQKYYIIIPDLHL